jgi:hypothetical protein
LKVRKEKVIIRSDGINNMWPKTIDMLFTAIGLGYNYVVNNGRTFENAILGFRRRPIERRGGHQFG